MISELCENTWLGIPALLCWRHFW